MRTIEVYLAEDEPPIADLIAEEVESAAGNFHVARIAHNGRTMADLVAARPPDLLLADIRMPAMDGLSLVKKAREQWPDLICVVLTSYAEFSYVQEAMRLGAFDYVLKTDLSGNLPVVLAKVAALIARRRRDQDREAVRRDLVLPRRAPGRPGPAFAAYQLWLLPGPGPQDDPAEGPLLVDLGQASRGRRLALACLYAPPSAPPPGTEEPAPEGSQPPGDSLRGPLFTDLADFASQVDQLLDEAEGCDSSGPPEDAHHSATRLREELDRAAREVFDFRGLCGRNGYNPQYLARVFKSVYGITPKRYHTQAKIRLVTQWLQEDPDLLLKEAASRVGFEDELYLAKVFKQETGLTFTAYRGSAGDKPHRGLPAERAGSVIKGPGLPTR